MLQLRDYQIQAKEELRALMAKGSRRNILCKPTGAGKTVTFASMVDDSTKKEFVCMIMCDRKELIKQAFDKVNKLGLLPTIIAPKYKQTKNILYLASVDTLRRRELPHVDLIIVDEAHKQSFDNILNKYIEFCDPYIIGATATPLRTGSQNSLSDIYTGMVEPVTTQDLINQGYLVPARTFAAKEDFNDVKKKGNDYDQSALFQKFNDTVLYDGVIDNYNKFTPNQKAICFNVNVEHSKKMCEAFRNAGVSAEHIDGNTPEKIRESILQGFTLGRFKVLCNCSVLTTGFDEPSIEVVIVNRATLSLPLWLQMCGRGSRVFGNKQNFTILDHGGNAFRHGLWEEDREWSLHKKKKREGDGVAPIKVCEKCAALNYASARVCKECDEPFNIKEKKLKESEFIEIKPKVKFGGVKKINLKTASELELKEYAKERGYKSSWVQVQLNLRTQ